MSWTFDTPSFLLPFYCYQRDNLRLIHQALHIFTKNTDAGGILAALRDDDVGIALGWLDKLLVHRLEHLEITVYHHRNRSSTVDGITLDVANQALIGIRIHKTFRSIKSRKRLSTSVMIPSMITTGFGSTCTVSFSRLHLM